MKYRVVIQPQAHDDIEQTYRWIAQHSPVNAARWFNGLLEIIDSLSRYPTRCPLAPESERFERYIR